MATTIQVAGPTTISVEVTGGSVAVLGYSDNDNLPSIQFQDTQHDVRTVLSGQIPEEIVLTGTMARISLALVKWDEDVLNTILLSQRGTSAANNPVGRRLVSNNATFALTIEGDDGSTYVFGTCYLQPDGVGDSQWGNRERVLTLALNAITTAGTNLYTYTAAAE